MAEDRHAVVWPRGRKLVERRTLAPRLPSLGGRTIAFLWNHVFRGDEIFPVVERELTRRYPDLTVVGFDVFGSIYGGDERRTVAALPERLREHRIDAVVSAVGC
jgi:hypothetical protein